MREIKNTQEPLILRFHKGDNMNKFAVLLVSVFALAACGSKTATISSETVACNSPDMIERLEVVLTGSSNPPISEDFFNQTVGNTGMCSLVSSGTTVTIKKSSGSARLVNISGKGDVWVNSRRISQ